MDMKALSDTKHLSAPKRPQDGGSKPCASGASLNLISLLPIALPTENLDIVLCTASPLRNGDDMVELKLRGRSAPLAATSVSQPYTAADFVWDVTGGRLLGRVLPDLHEVPQHVREIAIAFRVSFVIELEAFPLPFGFFGGQRTDDSVTFQSTFSSVSLFLTLRMSPTSILPKGFELCHEWLSSMASAPLWYVFLGCILIRSPPCTTQLNR